MLTALLLLLGLAVVLSVVALARNGVLSGEAPGLGERLRLAMTGHVATAGPQSPYPELRPGDWPVAPEVLAERVAEAARELGWTVTTDPAKPDTVEAVVVTPLLRFRDDVSVTVAPGAAPGTATLQAESRSRVGRADYGANAAHLRRLLGAL